MGRTAESQTPHVAPGARRQLSLTPTPRTEDPFHTRRTNAAAFRIRGAFHRRIPSASLLAGARRETCRAATGTLGFAAVAQLPTRVCRHCCQLDLRTEPAIRRSTHATCRPFDFYSCVELRAQPRTHRLRCMLQATEVACAATAVPLAGTRRPGRHSSGVVLICLERQNDTRLDVRTSSADLPQPVRTQTSLCRLSMPATIWKKIGPATERSPERASLDAIGDSVSPDECRRFRREWRINAPS